MKNVFRFDISALKALAIFFVLFYHFFDLYNGYHHTNTNLFSSGFLGVDIFFVISGYLITTSLMYRVYNNSFNFFEFYKRRLAKIYPPFIVLCAFVLLAGYFLMMPNVYLEGAKECLQTLLTFENYILANNGGYFDLQSYEKLLLHTWYICITVHFYLIYPLIIFAFLKFFGSKSVPTAVYTLTALTLIISIACTYTSYKGYLQTHTRIWELFFGASLFFISEHLKSYLNDKSRMQLLMQILGFFIIIFSVFYVELDGGIYRTHVSFLTVIGTSLVLLSNCQNKVLANPFVTAIGNSSYSIYLWHWPILIFCLRCGSNCSISSLVFVFALLAFTTVISYKFTEKKQPRNFVTVSLLCLVVGGCFYIKHNNGNNYLTQYLIEDSERFNFNGWNTTLPEQYNPTEVIKKDGHIVYHYGDQTQKPNFAIIGDSHLLHYNTYFRNISKLPLYFYGVGGNMCYGKNILQLRYADPEVNKSKNVYYQTYLEILDLLSPNGKVILSNFWNVHYEYYYMGENLKDTPENLAKYVDMVIQDIDEEVLKRQDLHFYIVGDGIVTDPCIVTSLKTNVKGSFLEYFIGSDKYNSAVDTRKDRFNAFNNAFKNYADTRDNVTFIDRTVPITNDDGTYRIYTDDGLPIYRDDNHYTDVGGRIVAEYIIEQVNKN